MSIPIEAYESEYLSMYTIQYRQQESNSAVSEKKVVFIECKFFNSESSDLNILFIYNYSEVVRFK